MSQSELNGHEEWVVSAAPTPAAPKDTVEQTVDTSKAKNVLHVLRPDLFLVRVLLSGVERLCRCGERPGDGRPEQRNIPLISLLTRSRHVCSAGRFPVSKVTPRRRICMRDLYSFLKAAFAAKLSSEGAKGGGSKVAKNRLRQNEHLSASTASWVSRQISLKVARSRSS